MKFLIEGEEALFDKVQETFPQEASLLSDILNLDITFIIKNSVWALKEGEYNPIKIDIKDTLKHFETAFYKTSPYNELIAKAIGLKKGRDKPSVLDATGGLLGDSLFMLSLGVEKLTVFERNPLPSCLIINALKQYETPIQFEHKDATEINSYFDVIYYDPMYGDKSSKATPRKEMVIFRKWVGQDHDARETALHLKKFALSRLVIKRPIKSDTLLPAPSLVFKGKSTRYDVYLSI